LNKLRRAAVLTAASTAIALLSALIPSASFASTTPPPPSPDNDPAKLAQITVAPTGPNVTTLNFAPEPSSGSKGVNPLATRANSGTLKGTGDKVIKPAGGSSGGLYDAFTSTVKVTSTYTNMNGSSQGVWEGSSPLNANKISLLDTISTTGVGITLSAGPVGSSFGWASGVWSYSTAFANQYMLSHNYSGLQFQGAVLTITESSQVAATFGTATYLQITN
jgi:hypothetical protein